jgi:hypothetical protein
MGNRVDQRDRLLPDDRTNIHSLIEIANGLSNWFLEGQMAQPMSEAGAKTKRLDRPKQNGSAQRQQVAARQKLHAIYRAQVEQVKRGERGEIDRELFQWLTMWLRRLFAERDPVIAMEEFLRGKKRRGKRAKKTDQDYFDIAFAVAKRMRLERLTQAKAVLAVSKERNLSEDWVRNIYQQRRRPAHASVSLSYGTTTSRPKS